MIRMLGVLCGAAIAIALLTWLVGIPQFTSEREAADAPLTVVALRDSVTADPPEPAMPVADANEPAAPEAAPQVEPLPDADSPVGKEPAAVSATSDAYQREPVLEMAAFPGPQWFAFWTPFRSEIAASGFIGRLQSVTGLDYRVVKVRPGVYEVAFAYTEEAEIHSNLSTISAATGLDLPGAQ